MITLKGTPAAVVDETVSPEEISYLVATESPVVFTFQKVDGNVLSVTEFTSPYDFTVDIEHDGGAIAENGTVVYIYDTLFGGMVEYTAYGGDPNHIYLDIPWEARFATDWLYILSPQYGRNSYLEVRLKINDVYEASTVRYTPDSAGLIEADISRYLQAKVTNEKIGNYDSENIPETNQSGKFELEYRERYEGDSSTWIEETNTWYYIYAVRTKEQGSNLKEFCNLELFNIFEKPIWWVGMPFDIQFWWNPKYEGLAMVRRHYDAAGTLLSSSKSDGFDTDGIGYLNSVRIDTDSIEELCDYMEIEFEEE